VLRKTVLGYTTKQKKSEMECMPAPAKRRTRVGPMRRLEEVAFRKGTEYADDEDRESQGTENSLQEDGVLNLAKGGLLDPDLAIEDLADKVPFLILGNPWLVLIAVA